MKDPVKLTHSHLEIRSMVEELESVHFPSPEFQEMVRLYEDADRIRNKTTSSMSVSELEQHYFDLSKAYEYMQEAAKAYTNLKDEDPEKKQEKNRTPEEEKRYRTAKAIQKYANEMKDSCLYYRSELYGIEQVSRYDQTLKINSAKIDSRKNDAIELCRLALKLKTLQENDNQYLVTHFDDGRVGYVKDEPNVVGIFPAGCDPENPKTLANLSYNAIELLDEIEIKETPENAKWMAEKAYSMIKPFDDLSDVSDYIMKAYKGVSGKSWGGVELSKLNTLDTEQGHLYFKAVKDRFYDNDQNLRDYLAQKIEQHNWLVENAGGSVNGLSKIDVKTDSKTFYQDLQNAVSQKDGEKYKVDSKGNRKYLPGTEQLGKLAGRMLRFRKTVDEIAPEKVNETANDHDTIKTGREEQALKPIITQAVERMQNNPIKNQDSKELNLCMGQIAGSFRAMNTQLEKCEKGSPIYVYAQDRAIEPLKNYMVSAVKRYNELHENKLNVPDVQENAMVFFQTLKIEASRKLPVGDPIFEIADKAGKIAGVQLTELGQEFAHRMDQQKEYKKLAARFKNEVDKSMFPSDEYKEMARLFKKAASVENTPREADRSADYQKLYNAASEYLLHKDPELNGKPNKKLSEYEEKRVKFARDLREFCKNGGAKPEYYQKEHRFTERKVQQPAKGGLGLG